MKYVALTQRVQVLPEINERRDCLSQDWTQLAATCGFTPILLPNNQAVVKDMLANLPLSGVILTGGNDLASLGGDAPERDALEHMLIDYAIDNQFPLLGVCRGMQVLLEHFDIPLKKIENHVGVRHVISNGCEVNSFHSYGVTRCKSPLMELCYSLDGVVEAVQHIKCPWIWGMMWHPEREHPMQELDVGLIKELFKL